MTIGHASDIEALLRRAGTPDLRYLAFHNPPTRRIPPSAAPEEQAGASAPGDEAPEMPEVFPVPPMAAAPAPAAPAAVPGPEPAAAPAGTLIRLPLVEQALSAAAPPTAPPASSTLARLRAVAR